MAFSPILISKIRSSDVTLKNTFFPQSGPQRAARKRWREQDAAQFRSGSLSYIDNDAVIVRLRERSLRDIISKIDSPAVIVVWSIGMVQASAEELEGGSDVNALSVQAVLPMSPSQSMIKLHLIHLRCFPPRSSCDIVRAISNNQFR